MVLKNLHQFWIIKATIFFIVEICSYIHGNEADKNSLGVVVWKSQSLINNEMIMNVNDGKQIIALRNTSLSWQTTLHTLKQWKI